MLEPDPLIGQRLASFRIDNLIKRGGMAQVYRGWDVMLQRPVAIKVVDERFRDNPAYTDRFLREARAAAMWRHPHIMQIYSADVQDGLYYFAMEYIDGYDLGELMARYMADGELMPHADVLKIGRAVSDALTYAHENGVIHRDVKPSNIMLSIDDRILLADFGLAMAMDEGTETEFLGTPHYISPEQAIRAGDAVPQSDLYSLGVILYEMLAGLPPFNDPSLTGLAFKHIHDSPASPRSLNPALGVEVEQVLLRALSKQPAERYATGQELMDALEEALQAGHPVVGGWVDLPPLPSGISPMEVADSLSQLSQQSVVEKIAFQLEQEEAAAQLTLPKPSLAIVGWGVLGLIVAVGLILLGTWLWNLSGVRGLAGETAVLPTQMADVATAAPLPSPVSVQLTRVQAAPSPTPMPTEAATIGPTETAVLPTATAIPEVTITPMPLPAFDGPPVQFIYDNRSFYALNPGSAAIEAANLSFMAVDAQDESAGYRFLGRDWAKFYPRIEPGGCTQIEPIAFSDFLRPDECESYNALVTPSLLDDTLFWLPREEVDQFAVFWNGELIGYCEIVLGNCSLRLPS